MAIKKEEIENLLSKYKKKISSNLKYSLDTSLDEEIKPVSSSQYLEFKKLYLPKHLSYYEQLCKSLGNLLKLKPIKSLDKKYQKAIETSHLSITPTGAYSFAILIPIFFILVGFLFGTIFFNSMFVSIIMLLLGASLFKPLLNYPMDTADMWRLEASNQMILCVFYIVTYMRHTSNLELAIEFAGQHLQPPLALDMRKILWDLESEKYENIRESIEAYLESWKDYNQEFIESMHLIESSLFETNEDRRLGNLDKALDIILSETYEKMLHYAQGLQGPITTLNMLGVIMPILGLVILPLVASFMDDAKWYHIAALYNLLLPISVFRMGKNILKSRPSGYGNAEIKMEPEELEKLQKLEIKFSGKKFYLDPKMIAISILVVGLFLGYSPLWLHVIAPNFDGPTCDIYKENDFNCVLWWGGKFRLMGWRFDKKTGENVIGPFGVGATLLSLLIPLSIGFSIGSYYKIKSSKLIKIREDAKKLEIEFSGALFLLGNRIGDGLPVEIAFSKIAENTEGSVAGKFFFEVSQNINRLGMGVEEAIFDSEHGAVNKFPSPMIESSMKVLVESAKKGPQIAAQALMNISRYVKEMHRVEERLKDLMAETLGSMRGQVKFLTPAISGIVIGITSMVTSILGRLGSQVADLAAKSDAQSNTGGVLSLFGDGIPTFYFQMVVGIYIVQLVLVLTYMINGLENGVDKLNHRYLLGKNCLMSIPKYVMIAGVIVIVFNLIAASILGGLNTG